jgi:hypothetical protein
VFFYGHKKNRAEAQEKVLDKGGRPCRATLGHMGRALRVIGRQWTGAEESFRPLPLLASGGRQLRISLEFLLLSSLEDGLP